MRVVMLGTGDAIGTPKIGCKCPTCLDALNGGRSRRLRFSILLEGDNGRVLVDTSPDLRWQLIKMNISKVDAVIWTHAHYDHYAGFGDFHRVQNHVPVYGTKSTLDYIISYLYFLKPERHEVKPLVPFKIAGMDFMLFEVNHPPVETMGVLVCDDNKKIVITSDTNDSLPDSSLDIIKDADLFIADAIMPPGYRLNKHMNAEEAMNLARSLNAKHILLTHISHLYPPHEEAVKRWPLAHDMMSIVL